MAIETEGCGRAIERLVGYPPVDLDTEISPLLGQVVGWSAGLRS